MTICPIAIAVHCTGCPIFKFCPAKTILGDYKEENSEIAYKLNTRKTDNQNSEEEAADETDKPL
jgi:hypothetical protein